ncbi:two-component sensor histidine kinase [Planosporangium thailandense]|uniref:histidine kinase n=1 Tax=Planosporangium thailandense TaxID=765197 RepID=A0ABX0Y0B2_9ACTN|nr:histidine kinase [Planosporangium thailandense]NJC71035.1 two-component sensor histidine kinase [Planosporangium thailandense]
MSARLRLRRPTSARDGGPSVAASDLHGLVRLAGWATVGAVAVATVAAGLPAGPVAGVATVAVTVAGLALWCLALLPRVTAVPVLTAALVGTGLAGAAVDALHPSGPGIVLTCMAMAGLGFGVPRRPGLAGVAVIMLGAGWAEARASAHPLGAVLDLAAAAGFLYLAAAFAAVSRDAHTHSQALLEQEAATRAAREEAAVLAERGRLARELHDVLAHTLSGLAVQLEGARLLAERTGADPRLAEQVINAQRLARDGMVNAKRAVATLRGEALPGPEQLPALIEQTRLSGLPVMLAVTGRPRPLPSESGLAVYRAVQEALTNAAKHAGRGATVTVALTWTDTALTAQVTDAGGDRVTAGLPSGGYGLAGLAERAALAGGRLDAGPTAEGWRVTLTMPIPATAGPVPPQSQEARS